MSNTLDTNQDVIDSAGGKGGDPRDLEYLRAYRTADSVVIPKDVFEKINPAQAQPRAMLRTVFGNPFPMPLMGFLMASTPLGCTLMGWRGAGGNGAALIGSFYFFGGMLQIIGSVMEWIIGNTFPCVVFASYGAFWLSLAATLQPDYNAMAAYVDPNSSAAAQTAGTAEYYNTFAFFFMIMTVLSFFYVIASLRTNVILFIVFFFIDMAFFLLMSTYWVLAEGRKAVAHNLQVAAGACVFVFCMFGWYLWFSLILTAMDFPFTLPLFDLSKRIPSATDRKKRKEYQEGTTDQNGNAEKQA